MILCLGNFYLNLGLLGDFAKDALLASFVLLFLQIHFFVSISEIKEYRDKKNAEKFNDAQ